MQFISVDSAGPFAPALATANSSAAAEVASGLVDTSMSSALTVSSWIGNRLNHLRTNPVLIARHFEHLTQEDSRRAKVVLASTGEAAGDLNLESWLFDPLMAQLGLE